MKWIESALPSKVTLYHRRIIKDPKELICPWYRNGVENDMHLLFHCKVIKKF